MTEPTYKEQWIIKVDDKEFLTDKAGKDKVIGAMQANKRFVALSEKDFISIRHISYIFLASKQIGLQLNAGNKVEVPYKPISEQRLREIRKEIRQKVGTLPKNS